MDEARQEAIAPKPKSDYRDGLFIDRMAHWLSCPWPSHKRGTEGTKTLRRPAKGRGICSKADEVRKLSRTENPPSAGPAGQSVADFWLKQPARDRSSPAPQPSCASGRARTSGDHPSFS